MFTHMVVKTGDVKLVFCCSYSDIMQEFADIQIIINI